MPQNQTFTIAGFYERNPIYKENIKNLGGTKMTQQDTTWQDEEIKQIKTPTGDFEKLPGLVLKENELTEITLDVSKKFNTFDTTGMKGEPVSKAIIPVLYSGNKLNWWLNKKNPVYKQILELSKGKTSLTLKILQTGKQQNTKYIIVQ